MEIVLLVIAVFLAVIILSKAAEWGIRIIGGIVIIILLWPLLVDLLNQVRVAIENL
jgi:hypothetical protein